MGKQGNPREGQEAAASTLDIRDHFVTLRPW